MPSDPKTKPLSASTAETSSASDVLTFSEPNSESGDQPFAAVEKATHCKLCNEHIDPNDDTNFKEIVVWVHGKKMDGATARHHTGSIAHEECVRLFQDGQDPEQERLF